MLRWWSLIAAGALFTAPLVAPGAATACACGGLLSSDPSLRVADELALVTGDGTVETVVMRLNLDTSADNAALVMPTPTPATVSAAPAELLGELATLSAPRVETVKRWTIGWGASGASAEGATAAAPGSGPGNPTVVQQVQLGPLEATTLSGGDLSGVRNWLADNGYELRPEISEGLDPYLREGWSIVAMRLTTDDAALSGPLAPVTLTFESEELVYPMRMSAHADTGQTVTIYTLGQHRMQRDDPDAGDHIVAQEYAGSIAGRTQNVTLRELSKSGAYLTKLTTTIVDPDSITSDFVFVDAPDDDPYQPVIYSYERVDLTVPVLIGSIVLVVTAGVLVGRWLTRGARRPPTAP
ncbi:DUF2330 domain-containing protein [Mycolicibacterium sp. BiH015]|uniref:DUF2330 domain-containing protein n=1 Tax=Mycolicibacterium sp. BiH015 TaxID=3018808 RepID=UPI0022E05D01|nr:DUF2330 domain-containing protein [Mycolicibacterium sp. BiH015]MDA2891724.1 DUF2330 domain-containing protein [Mycolicibacterium sp. BiH015]